MIFVEPYYQDDAVTIYHGDYREVMPTLQNIEAVVTDPPWGARTATNSQRFTRKSSPWWSNVDVSTIIAHAPIMGDEEPFDPTPWLAMDCPLILWGANHFAHRLPPSGGWLVWDKRKGIEDMAEKGWPLGEGELAWTNIVGAVRIYRNLWHGLLRTEQRGEFLHPTMKPISLMRWCLGIGSLADAQIILDPFMGSGTTLRAAKDLGRKAIGIEIEERYCELAARRMRQTAMGL